MRDHNSKMIRKMAMKSKHMRQWQKIGHMKSRKDLKYTKTLEILSRGKLNLGKILF